jgi:hypothetical protein
MTTAAAPSTLRSLVAIPTSYDGSESDYPTWKRQVKLYVRANAAQLPDHESKQLVALSYMKSGKAARWSNTVIDHLLAGTFGYNTVTTATTPAQTTFNMYTWDQFWDVADAVFNPPNTQNNAAIKLDKLHQGQMSAEEYFIEFDMLAGTAGYNDIMFDQIKIRTANQSLNKALVANIHNIDHLPTTWEGYKTRTIALDNNWRIGRAARSSDKSSSNAQNVP